MKVLFDFDDVIFNSQGFKNFMFQVLKDRGCVNVKSLYENTRKNGQLFSLYDFIHEADNTFTSEVQEEIYQQIIGISEHCINQEVFDSMKRLGKQNCYIVTSGEPRFQMDKIKRSIGSDAVQEVIVVGVSKAEVIHNLCRKHADEEIIFVDNDANFFKDIDMMQCENLKTVLFNENGIGNLEAELQKSIHNEQLKKAPSSENRPNGLH